MDCLFERSGADNVLLKSGSQPQSSWEMKDEQERPWNETLIILKDPVDSNRLFALMRVVKGLT